MSLFLQCFLGFSHALEAVRPASETWRVEFHTQCTEVKESFQIAHQGRFAASTAIEEGHMTRKLHHQCSVVEHYVPQPCLRLNPKHPSQMLIIHYVLVPQELQEESLQNPSPTNILKTN